MMSNEQFQQLMSKLDTLIKISVITAFQGKSRAEVISILADLGFGNKEIAGVLGTTPAYVANVRHETKKQRAGQQTASKQAKKASSNE
jgi:hypothetical protein